MEDLRLTEAELRELEKTPERAIRLKRGNPPRSPSGHTSNLAFGIRRSILYPMISMRRWRILRAICESADYEVTEMGVEKNDLTVPVSGGVLNVRVGAIILRDNKVLMVGNDHVDYCYSVGGRVKFGETAEQAVEREVYEETGVRMPVDRLGFIHENYFRCDMGPFKDRWVYEISFFFYMQVPEDFSPLCRSAFVDGSPEYLVDLPPDTDRKIYPEFFRTELLNPVPYVKHIVTDERL